MTTLFSGFKRCFVFFNTYFSVKRMWKYKVAENGNSLVKYKYLKLLFESSCNRSQSITDSSSSKAS